MGRKYKEFNKVFIKKKKNNEKSEAGYVFEVDVKYPEKNNGELHGDLPFLPERKKIKKTKNL